MTDNRTTELREKLNKLIIELDRLDITLDSPASDMTLGEYEQEREKLLDGFMQAIAVTLGSGTCKLDYDRNCSNCGAYVHEKAVLVRKDLDGGVWTVVAKPPSFCPNCGAKVMKQCTS